jgi:hypothetical protein
VEFVEMDNEELNVPDDVLEKASVQMLAKKSKLRFQKKLEKLTSE